MVSISQLKTGNKFFHPGISEMVFDREATAELLGCSTATLSRLKNKVKGGLKPLKARVAGRCVYAQSDIENYLSNR